MRVTVDLEIAAVVMVGDFGPGAAGLLTVGAVVAVGLAWWVILRRRAARRVARWTRELIDPMRLQAELAGPVTPGHDTSQLTGSVGPSHTDDG